MPTKTLTPFRLRPKETLILDEPGQEVALSFVSPPQICLRTRSGISYHGSWASALRHIRDGIRFKVPDSALLTFDSAIQAERHALSLIEAVSERLSQDFGK